MTLTNPTPAPAVLVAHGFGGTKASVDADARALVDRGFVVLTWTARGFGASGVVGVQGLDDLLDGGAQHRTLSRVARVAHDGLLGALLGGLDIGHSGGFLKNRCNGNSKLESMMARKMYVKSIVKRKHG